MQNEFDDNIKKQIDGFKLKPSPQIWERVEAQLPEKKRSRFAIWWWLPGLSILLGIGFYQLGVQHGKLKSSINTDKNKITLIREIDSIKVTKNELKNRNIIAIKTKSPLNKIKKKEQFKSITEINKRKKLLIDSKLVSVAKSMSNNNQNNINNGNLFDNKDEKRTKKSHLNPFEYLNKIDDSIKINIYLNSTKINKNIDSTNVENTKNDGVITKKDTVLSIAKKTIKTNNTFKIKWELTASIGTSNTVGKAFSNGASSNYNFANSASSPTSNPQPQASSLATPKAGISFAAGVQRTQRINKKWSWYGSFQYAYLSNHQASGAFVDSSLALANPQSSVSNYYKYGNTVEHLNQIHRFDVSGGFLYSFNPNSSKAFSLYGGLVVGYQFSNNWLQADTKQPVLYYSNSLTTKLITGSRFGLDWELGKRFSASAFYEFSFTNASLSSTQYHLHWQMFGAKILIPFTFNKTKTIVQH